MNYQDSLLGVIKTFFKWKKPIIWFCSAVAIGAVIISLMLPNFYKAITIFYAASPDLAKPAVVGTLDKDIEYYGEDEDVDRVLSIANSGELADHLINKYNLYEHYEINKDNIKAPYKVKKKFFKLYNTKKTKFDGIEITMEDKDRELAAQIANEARNKVSEIAQRVIKESQLKQINTYIENIKSKQAEMVILNDSLYRQRKRYGVYDTNSQGQVMSEILSKTQSALIGSESKLGVFNKSPNTYRDSISYYKVKITSLKAQLEKVDLQVQLFNDGLAQITFLELEQEESGNQLSLDKERYKQLMASYNSDFTAVHIVEDADVPIIKSRPKRSIYCISAVMLAFIFSLIGVLVLEKYRSINWDEIVNPQ